METPKSDRFNNNIYISGPISSNPDHEIWFDAVERHVWSTGLYDFVFNPDKIGAAYEIEHPYDISLTAEQIRIRRLNRDADLLERCEFIIFMPGWNKATGCIAEYMAARALHLEKIFISDEEMKDILLKFGRK